MQSESQNPSKKKLIKLIYYDIVRIFWQESIRERLQDYLNTKFY